MKFIVALIIVVFALLVQYCLFAAWSSDLVIPSVTLAVLVVLSFYVEVEQMMWLGLIGGLFSDLYSGAEFGLYLGLFILVVLICKVVLNFGAANRSWWQATLVLIIASILEAIALIVPMVGTTLSSNLPTLLWQIFWFVSSTVAVGIVVFVLLGFATNNFSRYFQTKATQK